MRSGKDHRLEFPEPVYSVFNDANPEYQTTVLRYRYQSLITPDSVYDYDMVTKEKKLLKQTEVLGGYDPRLYKSERIFATATDGTKIPISLVYKNERKVHVPLPPAAGAARAAAGPLTAYTAFQRDGTTPLLLYGYGSYGATMPVNFSPVMSCPPTSSGCLRSVVRHIPWSELAHMVSVLAKSTATAWTSVAWTGSRS